MQNPSGKFRHLLTAWLVPFFLILAAFLLLLLSSYPNLKKVLTIRAEIARNENRLQEKLIPKAATLANLDEQKLNSDLKQVVVLLPDQLEPPVLLSTIEEAAGRAGVAVGSLQYQLNNASGQNKFALEDLNLVNLGFLVKGGKSQITEFLQILFQAAPISSLESVALSLEESGSSEATTSIVIDFFNSPLPNKLPALDAKLEPLTKDEQDTLLTISGFTNLLSSEAEGGSGETAPAQPRETEKSGKSNPF